MAVALLLLALSFPILFTLLWPSKKQTGLPPGPRPWPALGNLPHLLVRQLVGQQQLHAVLASMAEAHGPLLHLRLGATDLAVASSPSAASQVFKSHDRALSGRHVPATYRVPAYSDHSLVWHVRCDDYWRSLRGLFRAELLSAQSLDGSAAAREKKAADMVRFLLSRQGEEVKIGEVAFVTIFNMVGNMVFSKDVLALEEGKGWFPELKAHMARILDLGLVPNVEDFFPAVTGGLDLQGLRREVEVYTEKVYGMWDEVLRQRREETEKEGGSEAKDDFLNALLASPGLGDTQLKALMLDTFTAGTDTSTSLTEWTLSELVKNPKAMQEVRDELQRVLGDPKEGNNTVKESHLVHLPYLHACIKETLRLHPPAPLLLPHRAVETCQVMDYTIPEGCAVMVNAWAIGRDPAVWKDPLRFSPERFLDCPWDYKGLDFEFVPFGGGRRTCPGFSMATRIVRLVVASTVHNFDWFLPNGMDPTELCMDERLGLVLERKRPLVLIPKSRMGA